MGQTIKNSRLCYICACPIQDEDVVICPRCGASELDPRRCRPSRMERRSAPLMPGPLGHIGLEHGGTLLLSGGPGSGKTSICLRAHPTRVETSEQEPEKVWHAWRRINRDTGAPLFATCGSWDDLDEDLLGLTPDDLVLVDSITQLASAEESKTVIRRCVERIRKSGARGLFIAHYTKDNEMFGPNELRHQVDIVAEIPNDPTGLRRIAVKKNRYGPLSTVYFRLGDDGVNDQNFPACYSVEGSAGNYALHLYPLGRAQFGGLFDYLLEGHVQVEGYAAAAIPCALYPSGFAEPPDAQERRAFAEAHHLAWITPELAHAWVEERALPSPTNKETS